MGLRFAVFVKQRVCTLALQEGLRLLEVHVTPCSKFGFISAH